MTTLDSKDHYATLINMLTVEPERAEQLLEVLSRATEETMRHLPGFVSAKPARQSRPQTRRQLRAVEKPGRHHVHAAVAGGFAQLGHGKRALCSTVWRQAIASSTTLDVSTRATGLGCGPEGVRNHRRWCSTRQSCKRT
jgi:hypothetical protein